jgi:hypothetical protein
MEVIIKSLNEAYEDLHKAKPYTRVKRGKFEHVKGSTKTRLEINRLQTEHNMLKDDLDRIVNKKVKPQGPHKTVEAIENRLGDIAGKINTIQEKSELPLREENKRVPSEADKAAYQRAKFVVHRY